MSRPTRTLAIVSVAACLISGAAYAASITSDDFVAVVGPSADYLAASSELALATTDSRAIRAFARAQHDEARVLARGVTGWREAEAQAETLASEAPTIDHLGPAANAISVPLEAIARTASSPAYFFTRLPSAGRLEDASRADLARLTALRGTSFDALYVETDLAALRRLEWVCRDFVLNGEDETLRALAVHALPKLRQRIARLERS